MELVHAEHIDADASFRYWNFDLHRPEVLIWSGQRQVPAVLEDRRPDGTVVFSVAEAGRLADLTPGGRLALVFRADEARLKRGKVVPLWTDDYSMNHRSGTIEARFSPGRAVNRHYSLPDPFAGVLSSSALFRRPRQVTVVRLSPYGGELLTEDPGRCLIPGMTGVIDAWVPWLGALRLRVQLTACQEEGGQVRYLFRAVDGKSVRTAAIVLAGTVEEFGFEELRAHGVPPSRLTRHLAVQTVSDDAAFQTALTVRLVGNRNFGRLATVDDPVEVADELDAHSVNFLCLLGNKALGAGRVVVNNGKRTLSETESETSGLPAHIWRGGFVEVSRVAIHPAYRSAGVIVVLFREVARLAFNLNCRYLVLDAIEKLVPTYEKIGAKRLSVMKTHPYSKESVHVMSIDIGEQLSSLDRRWLYWQYVFGPALKHHFDTSSHEALTKQVRSLGHIPFWVKRTVARVS